MTPYRVALLGLGTVGRAVAERLLADADEIAAVAGGRPISLVAISVRSEARLDGLPLGADVEQGSDPAALLERLLTGERVDAVVELLGGLEPAGSLIRTALGRGVAVVTANKALLAERGQELEDLSRRSGAGLRFEAAVAGGTPLLATLAEQLTTMRIERIRGVINGSTNWILDAMEHQGLSAADALAAAQLAGYAEADPTLDTHGHDPAQKLVVLGRLAFGEWIRPADVRRVATEPPGEGGPAIAAVTAEDVISAAVRGQRVRLVAEIARDPARDGRPSASVLPRFLPLDDPLAAAGGVTNVIEIHGWPLGRVVISGPGAGGPQTASAVLADLARLARGDGSTWAGLPRAAGLPPAAGLPRSADAPPGQ